jgi:transcriptional regulator with AAA-type ATPase domain
LLKNNLDAFALGWPGNARELVNFILHSITVFGGGEQRLTKTIIETALELWKSRQPITNEEWKKITANIISQSREKTGIFNEKQKPRKIDLKNSLLRVRKTMDTYNDAARKILENDRYRNDQTRIIPKSDLHGTAYSMGKVKSNHYQNYTNWSMNKNNKELIKQIYDQNKTQYAALVRCELLDFLINNSD